MGLGGTFSRLNFYIFYFQLNSYFARESHLVNVDYEILDFIFPPNQNLNL